MKKSNIIIILMFLIYSINVLSSYESVSGGLDNWYQMDDGVWNTQLTGETSSLRNLNGVSIEIPLYSDLDNNGINEIIVLDSQAIRVFTYTNLLTETASINHHCNITYDHAPDFSFTNIEIYDVDGNGLKDIIFGCLEDYEMKFYEYNNSILSARLIDDYSSKFNQSLYYEGEGLIKCDDQDECIFLMMTESGGSTGSGRTHYGFMDSSGIIAYMNVTDQDQGGLSQLCLPMNADISVRDYDLDSSKEYVYSFHQGTSVYIESFQLNGNSFFRDRLLNIPVAHNGNHACYNQAYNYGRIFTNVAIADVHSSPGYEMIIGYTTSTAEYRMSVISSDGIEIDTHPETFEADGYIISNVIIGNFFPDTNNNKDYCVMGYNHINQELDLLCGSQETNKPYQTYEFIINISQYGQMDIYKYNANYVLLGSSQQSSILTSGTNLDEVHNGYGIMSLDWSTTCRNQLLNDILCLNMEKVNPNVNGSLSMFDYQDNGRSDMIVLDNRTIRYYDDGFVNTQGYIDSYYINPCIDSVWKQNTSVEVRASVNDIDSDNTQIRFIMYQNETFAQDSGWSTEMPTDTIVSQTFNANITGNFYNLMIMGRDTQNPTQIDTINFTFSVNINGVEAGDCITQQSDIYSNTTITTGTGTSILGGEYNGSVAVNVQNNILTDSIDPIVTRTGLGYTVIWLFFMMIVAITVWISTYKTMNPTPVIAGIELLMIIIGTKLGYLSTALMIIIVLISIMIGALYIRNKFFNNSQTF